MRHLLAGVGLLVAGASYVLVAVLLEPGMTSATWAFLGFALCIAGLGAVALARAWAQVLFLFGNLIAALVALHSLRVTWGDLGLFLPTLAVTAGLAWAAVGAVRWAETHRPDFADGTFGLPLAYAAASLLTLAYFARSYDDAAFALADGMGVVGFALAAWDLRRVRRSTRPAARPRRPR